MHDVCISGEAEPEHCPVPELAAESTNFCKPRTSARNRFCGRQADINHRHGDTGANQSINECIHPFAREEFGCFVPPTAGVLPP